MVAAACLLSFWPWLVLARAASLEAGAGTGQLRHSAREPCSAVSGCEPVATAVAISPSLLQKKISKSVVRGNVSEEFETTVEAVKSLGSTHAQKASLFVTDSSNKEHGPQDPRPSPMSLAAESNFHTAQDIGGNATSGRKHVAPSSPGHSKDAFLLAASPPKVRKPAIVNEELFFRPVSTTLRCIMWLTILSLMLHTCLALARNFDELTGKTADEASVVTKVLTNAVRGTPFAPVMAMFFLAFRMYILASTHGLGEPSTFVKGCMVVATVGMTMQLTFCIVSGFVVARSSDFWHAGDHHTMFPRIDVSGLTGPTVIKGFSMVMQVLLMLFIHGGLACIFLAFIQTASFKVSAALSCTIALVATYVFVELARWVASGRIQATNLARVASNERKASKAARSAESALVMPEAAEQAAVEANLKRQLAASRAASNTVQKAPMLALLFLAARMRHIQENPPTGQAPAIVVGAFIVAAVSVACEVLVSAYIGYVGEEEWMEDEKKGEQTTKPYYRTYIYVGPRSAHCLQHFFSGLGLVSVVIVITSIVYQWGPASQQVLSSTMVGVLWLEGVYFTVQALMWVNAILRDVADIHWRLGRDTLIAASVGLNIAPLLGNLFLGAQMRALQISQGQGDPQWWEKVFIQISVASVMLQFLCCLCLPIFSGVASRLDHDNHAVYDLRPLALGFTVTLLKYFALIALHCGVFGICVAVFTMDPGSNLQDRPDRYPYWHAFVATLLWGLCAGFGAAVLATCKALGLTIKHALESVDPERLGAPIHVQDVKFNACTGYVEVRQLIIGNMINKGFDETKHLLQVDKVIVQLNIWVLFRSWGNEFEISKLMIDRAKMNIEWARRGPSNVRLLHTHLESLVVPSLSAVIKLLTPKEALRLYGVDISCLHVVVSHQRAGGKIVSLSIHDLHIPDKKEFNATLKGAFDLIAWLLKNVLRNVLENAEITGKVAKKNAEAMLASATTSVCCPRGRQSASHAAGDGEEEDAQDDEAEPSGEGKVRDILRT